MFWLGADFMAQMTCLEAQKAGVKAALWPFNATWPILGAIGRSFYDLAQALVMTVVANTPAAAAGPTSITGSKAVIADNFNHNLLYGPTLRKLPLRFALLPFLATADVKAFTTA